MVIRTLGGEDFDQRIMQVTFLEEFKKKKKTGLNAQTDKRALQKLRREAERANAHPLPHSIRHRIEIESSFFEGGHDLMETLTRERASSN